MGADASVRRFAAAVLVNAFKSLTPLFNSKRTPQQYFEAVESLVWIQSPVSIPYYEYLGWDPDVVLQRVDLPLYSDLALAAWEENKKAMRRMYFATAQYVIQIPGSPGMTYNKLGGAKIPTPKITQFVQHTLDETYSVLQAQATRGGSSVSQPERIAKILSNLEVLEQLEETLAK